jgi:hypothetical protein
MTTIGESNPDGILVMSEQQESWAWIGLRMAPASALGDSGAHLGLSEEQRRVEAALAEQAWLAAQWTSSSRMRFEVRYESDPRTRLVTCTLLGQVHGLDRATVVREARALRERLAAAPPRHVHTDVIQDTAELYRRLSPFSPAPGGLAEIRKRLAWAWSSRQDARRPIGVAVFPLENGNRSWEAIWAGLARQPRRTVLGVCLEPYPVSDGLSSRLGHLAQEYGRLAVNGRANPLYLQPVPPDSFAVQAAPMYADAARRYTGRAYRLRISIAADGAPIPMELAELLAATISAGVGTAVVRVPPQAEFARACGNLLALNREWLEETYRQGLPPGHHLHDVEQILSDLVDLSEAAVAFRLPYEIPARPPLFDSAGRAGDGPDLQWTESPAAPGADPGMPTFHER